MADPDKETVVLRGTKDQMEIEPEDINKFGLITQEMFLSVQYEPNPEKAQALIDRLNSDTRKESELFTGPGQHSMISRQTHIYPRPNGGKK